MEFPTSPQPAYKSRRPSATGLYTLMLDGKGGRADHAHRIHRQRRQQSGRPLAPAPIVIPAKDLAVALAVETTSRVPIDRVFISQVRIWTAPAWSRDVTVPFLDCHLFRSVHRRWRCAVRPPPCSGRTRRQNPACQFHPPPHRPGDRRLPDGDHRPPSGHHRFERFAPATLRHHAHLAPFGTLQGAISA